MSITKADIGGEVSLVHTCCLRHLLVAVCEFVQCILGDDVATHEADGRVEGTALLTQDGTREDGVEPTLLAQVDLHLSQCQQLSTFM